MLQLQSFQWIQFNYLMNESKKIVFEIDIFCNIIHVYAVTVNVPLKNKKYKFFQNKYFWPDTFLNGDVLLAVYCVEFL